MMRDGRWHITISATADLGGAGKRAARQRHRDAARHALRHPRRDADPHVRPRPAHALRPAGHAVIHTAPNVEGARRRTPAGYAPICVGTTTSDRMERFTRPLMQQYGVRLIIGKGGLREDSLKSFAEMGGAYLAIIGGTAALETTWIEAIEDVDLDDLNPSRCGSSASTDSARCSLLWTATARASMPGSRPQRSRRRAEALKRLGVR